MAKLKDDPPKDFLFNLGHKLPGYFYVDDLNEQIAYNNKPFAQFFGFDQTEDQRFAMGMDVIAITHAMNQENPLMAAKHGNTLRHHNMTVLKERRSFLYDEIMPVNNKPMPIISHKGPLFDNNGYLIGVYGYMIDATEHLAMPDSLLCIYDEAEASLINLHQYQSKWHNAHSLRALINAIEDIEKKRQ